jgi:hypothetical protein
LRRAGEQQNAELFSFSLLNISRSFVQFLWLRERATVELHKRTRHGLVIAAQAIDDGVPNSPMSPPLEPLMAECRCTRSKPQ